MEKGYVELIAGLESSIVESRYTAAKLVTRQQLQLYHKIGEEKKNTVVEFAVKSIDKAMGVATYRTTKVMPSEMRGILPDADALARLL